MTTRFTIKDIEQLKKSGKIKGYVMPVKVEKKAKVPKVDKGSKNKAWIKLNLFYYAQANNLILVDEFRFHPRRRFRFDWALSNEERTIKIGIEYEGLFSEKSGHTTIGGFNKDTEKYNMATAAGWQMVRVTAINFKSVLSYIYQIVESKKSVA